MLSLLVKQKQFINFNIFFLGGFQCFSGGDQFFSTVTELTMQVITFLRDILYKLVRGIKLLCFFVNPKKMSP